jgi:hypothetical protein
MPTSPGATQFQYLYQIAPIVLTGGIASQMPGGAVSLISFTQPNDFISILSVGGISPSLDDSFAQFIPLPGATMIDQEIGSYPFANQMTAANAIITKPLMISFKMICPARGAGGYAAKQALMSGLQQTLTQHNLLGGLYGLATPAFFWNDSVMLGMRDISPPVDVGSSSQPQIIWQLDFIQPLVTQAEAQQAQNALLSKISSGTQFQPNANGEISASGAAAGAGNPASGQGSSVTPPVQGPGYGFGSAPGG